MSAHENVNITQFGGVGGNEYTAPNGKTYTMEHMSRGATEARTAGGRTAGRISTFGGSEPENQTIHQIKVSGPHQRKGLATALMDYQRIQQPDLHHSHALTPQGKHFAAATPRDWQPKLDPVGDYPGGLGDTNPMGWDKTKDFALKNARSYIRSKAEDTEQTRQKTVTEYNAKHYEQGKLF